MNKTPHQISEERILLAEAYSKYSDELADLINEQAIHFHQERKNHKSDTACQRAFEKTISGVRMTSLKLKLKSIEKTMSAYNTHLRLLENEAKNLY